MAASRLINQKYRLSLYGAIPSAKWGASKSRNFFRAIESRESTVPIGMASISAVSSVE
jgi:hypothetical protein